MIAGAILIILGAIFLLQNLGILTADAWDIFWPMLIILIGLSLLFKHKKHKRE